MKYFESYKINKRNPDTIKRITKGKSFKSILECKNYVNEKM